MHTPTIPQFQNGEQLRTAAELNGERSRVSNQLSDAVGKGEIPFPNQTGSRTNAAECMLIHERILSLYAARSVDL